MHVQQNIKFSLDIFSIKFNYLSLC